MANPTIGYIGERLDIIIRQGGTFGPHEVTLSNPDGSPVDLTGCLLRGQIRHESADTGVLCVIDFTITAPAAGKFTMGIADETTATLPCGPTVKDSLSVHVWDAELEDTTGRVIPLYYGDAKVFREVTRA